MRNVYDMVKDLGSLDIRNTIKDLLTEPVQNNRYVLVLGYHKVNDGGGGIFIYDEDKDIFNLIQKD